MFSSIFSLLVNFKDLYFNQIDPNKFSDFSDISTFINLFFLFLLLLSIFHSIVIYIFANLKNTYKYFRAILISTIYALAVSISFAKIFQTLFAIFLGYVPYAGNEMLIFDTYGALSIAYVFQVLLVNNRLKVLFERGKLDTAPIGSDIFLGVTVANLFTIIFFVLIH